MSTQATFSVRMDATLKKQFDAFCSDFGMSASTAITVFAKAVVREQKIPFEIAASRKLASEEGKQAFLMMRAEAEKNGTQDMSLENINREIEAVRKQ